MNYKVMKGRTNSTEDLGPRSGEVCALLKGQGWEFLNASSIYGDKRTSACIYLCWDVPTGCISLFSCLYFCSFFTGWIWMAHSLNAEDEKKWEKPLHLCKVFLDLPCLKVHRASGQGPPALEHLQPFDPSSPHPEPFHLNVLFLTAHQPCKRKSFPLVEYVWCQSESRVRNCKLIHQLSVALWCVKEFWTDQKSIFLANRAEPFRWFGSETVTVKPTSPLHLLVIIPFQEHWNS